MSFNHQQLWEQCLEIIKRSLGDDALFDLWFKDISSVSYEAGKLKLLVASSWVAEQLEERFYRHISNAINQVYGPNTTLYYKYMLEQGSPESSVTIKSSTPSPIILDEQRFDVKTSKNSLNNIPSQLHPRYTFENYCTGQANYMACSLAESIAKHPDNPTFNPLFVFGSTGVGKTHLIQAIGIKIKEDNPSKRVLYVAARQFQYQYTNAVINHEINKFFFFYQSIDTLIVDDIQDINGNEGTQNTFFHIFNHLQQNNKQIILSSDCAPADMVGFEERLLSRFKWGIPVKIDEPDLQLRRDVLSLKAQQSGLDLSDDVIEYIAQNITNSVRELEGVVTTLSYHAAMTGTPIDIEMAKTVVAQSIKIENKPVNFEIVTREVCSYYGIEADSIYTKSRKREVSDARQMVMYMAKKMCNLSLKSIGVRISRTHATVIYACRNIEDRLLNEKQLRDDIKSIQSAILAAV